MITKRPLTDDTGVAAIELALWLPVLTLLLFSGLELNNYFSFVKGVEESTAVVADSASRLNGIPNEAAIKGTMIAAATHMPDSYDLWANGRIRLSAVDSNLNGHTGAILWQRCYGHKALTFSGIGNVGNTADFSGWKSRPRLDHPLYIVEVSAGYDTGLLSSIIPSGTIERSVPAAGRFDQPGQIDPFGNFDTSCFIVSTKIQIASHSQ